MPHRPQPVGPAICRRRWISALARGSASHIRNSTPVSKVTTSSWRISAAEDTIPSVRLKPSAKSSRFCGVAIITA
jgi:hypothetical protein